MHPACNPAGRKKNGPLVRARTPRKLALNSLGSALASDDHNGAIGTSFFGQNYWISLPSTNSCEIRRECSLAKRSNRWRHILFRKAVIAGNQSSSQNFCLAVARMPAHSAFNLRMSKCLLARSLSCNNSYINDRHTRRTNYHVRLMEHIKKSLCSKS